jgi:hypothetical protein
MNALEQGAQRRLDAFHFAAARSSARTRQYHAVAEHDCGVLDERRIGKVRIGRQVNQLEAALFERSTIVRVLDERLAEVRRPKSGAGKAASERGWRWTDDRAREHWRSPCRVHLNSARVSLYIRSG